MENGDKKSIGRRYSRREKPEKWAIVHEIENDLSDRIVSYFGNESCRDTQSPQCNHGIERGTSRDGLCGKTVFEDDVENGFSDADNFTHKRFYFDSCSDCSRERCPK